MGSVKYFTLLAICFALHVSNGANRDDDLRPATAGSGRPAVQPKKTLHKNHGDGDAKKRAASAGLNRRLAVQTTSGLSMQPKWDGNTNAKRPARTQKNPKSGTTQAKKSGEGDAKSQATARQKPARKSSAQKTPRASTTAIPAVNAAVPAVATKPAHQQQLPNPLQDKDGVTTKPAQAQSEPDAKASQVKGANDGDVKLEAAAIPAVNAAVPAVVTKPAHEQQPPNPLQDKDGGAARPVQAQSEPDAKASQIKDADDGDVKLEAAAAPLESVDMLDSWQRKPEYIVIGSVVVPDWVTKPAQRKKLLIAAMQQKTLFPFGMGKQKGNVMMPEDFETVLAFAVGDDYPKLFKLSRNIRAFLVERTAQRSPRLLRHLGTIFYVDIRPAKPENKEGKNAPVSQQKALVLQPLDAIKAELCVHRLLQLARDALQNGGFDHGSPAARPYIKLLRKFKLDPVVTNFTHNRFDAKTTHHPLIRRAQAGDARSQAFCAYLQLTHQPARIINCIYDFQVGGWILGLALNADTPDALQRACKTNIYQRPFFDNLFDHSLEYIAANLQQLIAKVQATGDDEFFVNFIMRTLSLANTKKNDPATSLISDLERVILNIGHTASPRFAQQFINHFLALGQSSSLENAQRLLANLSKRYHHRRDSLSATSADWKAIVDSSVRVIKAHSAEDKRDAGEAVAVKEFVTLFSRPSLPFVGRAVFLTEYQADLWTEILKGQAVSTVLPAFKHDLSEVAPSEKPRLLSDVEWQKFATTYMSFVKTIPPQHKDWRGPLVNTFVKLIQKFHMPGEAQSSLIAKAVSG